MNQIEMDKWTKTDGEDFLKQIGMKKDFFVLDFGCRHGTYSIPAAKVVGENGIVYALDKNINSLDELMYKAKSFSLKNIKKIDVSEIINIPLDDEVVDMVLLFDVLHLIDDKKKLFRELKRVLKFNGILSVYSRHHEEHMSLKLDEVIDNIKMAGFGFESKIVKDLMHNDQIVKDQVLVFSKKLV